MRNVSEIVYVESLDCSGLVEKHKKRSVPLMSYSFVTDIAFYLETFL